MASKGLDNKKGKAIGKETNKKEVKDDGDLISAKIKFPLLLSLLPSLPQKPHTLLTSAAVTSELRQSSLFRLQLLSTSAFFS